MVHNTVFEPKDHWILLSQGAEARVWKTPDGMIWKERFCKKYRHPVLDERLTKQRCRSEARILEKCSMKQTVFRVPRVIKQESPVLGLEFLSGHVTVRQHLEDNLLVNPLSRATAITQLAQNMGRTFAALHSIGVVHGDLTTSNMMLLEDTSNDKKLALIDFGLAKNTESAEERAVDLYVLERALVSTHPRLPDDFMATVLQVYQEQSEANKSKATLQRLEQVRLRGRKRECFG